MHNDSAQPGPSRFATHTDRRNLDADERLQTLSKLSVPLWLYDVDATRVIWANTAGLQYWNAGDLPELRSRNLASDMSATVAAQLRQILHDCSTSKHAVNELWTLYPNGKPQTSEFTFAPFCLRDGHNVLLVQAHTELMQSSSQTLRSTQALQHTTAMISLYHNGEDCELLYANPAARTAAGRADQSLRDRLVKPALLKLILQQLDTYGFSHLEAEVNTVDGVAWHEMHVEASPDASTGSQSLLVSATDITARRNAQHNIQKLAYTDPLTGLANRTALLEQIGERCGKDSSAAVLFLDLDRFKLINDSLGHRVGDALLQTLARRMRKLVGNRGVVGRLGGDEFLIMLDHLGERRLEALAVAQHCRHTLSEPINAEGYNLSIECSIGIALAPDHGSTPELLIQRADAAMYCAKTGNAGECVFSTVMDLQSSKRLQLEQNLRVALIEQQFELYYQPKIEAMSGRVTSMEALLRWHHPILGIISPTEFIPVAEDTGQIVDIGVWVIQTAMRQQRQWADQGYDITVAINISPRQFLDPDLAIETQASLESSGCDPHRIELEITESTLLGDSTQLQNTLLELSELGIRFSVDDFGTGYSNLGYLQRYPLHSLKIDRMFVGDATQQNLLDLIIRIGKTLNLAVVAEGVETAAQAMWLRDHGCTELQGYLFSKPVAAELALEFLQSSREQQGISWASNAVDAALATTPTAA